MTTQQTYYLVGIKGVAMTALAQVLVDAGCTVLGSDVETSFVTEPQLQRLAVKCDPFTAPIPSNVDQVIYTAAHQAHLHPQVQEAVTRGIPTYSHAEALAQWFNQKQGVAVCGVGGKSTISAMITWILDRAQRAPSYAVGVGDIIGLNKTGRWDSGATFVAEADEYVTDPVGVQQGKTLIPRFQYLHPTITVASTISFDHPDVYKNEAHTREVFTEWFKQLPSSGVLISSDENRHWLEKAISHVPIIWYGEAPESELVLISDPVIIDQRSSATLQTGGESFTITLAVPGAYNMMNAVAAIAAAKQLGVSVADSIEHLASFRSTKRRFEHVGTFNEIECYDDYAHHPRELTVVLEAARQWFGSRRLVVAFQPHTYSRTKALFTDFVTALSTPSELLLLDIFGSARESVDPTISSDVLASALVQRNPTQNVQNLHTIEALEQYVRTQLQPGDVVLTLGAGDIYTVYEHLGVTHG